MKASRHLLPLLLLLASTAHAAGDAAAPAAATPPAEAATSADATQPAAAAEEKPVDVHYQFAHKLLPYFFYEHTYMFVGRLELDGAEGLRSLWKDFLQEEKNVLRTDDDLSALKVERRELAPGVLCYLITMPEPKDMVEAYYVALIIKKADRDLLVRTFELTYADLFGDRSKREAVYGGWLADGSHINMGHVPDTSAEAFVNRIMDEVVLGKEVPVLGASTPSAGASVEDTAAGPGAAAQPAQ